MKLTPLQRLSALGKFCVGMIATITGLLQINAVKNALLPLIDHHPHFASLIGGMTVIGALMSNPQVQEVLGFEQQRVTTKPDGTTIATTTTGTVTAPPGDS